MWKDRIDVSVFLVFDISLLLWSAPSERRGVMHTVTPFMHVAAVANTSVFPLPVGRMSSALRSECSCELAIIVDPMSHCHLWGVVLKMRWEVEVNSSSIPSIVRILDAMVLIHLLFLCFFWMAKIA